MTEEPSMLVCTRLANMTLVHPDQAWQLCSQCGHTVGVYPTGVRALEKHPGMKVICSTCCPPFNLPAGSTIMSAGTLSEIHQEARDSKPVGRA